MNRVDLARLARVSSDISEERFAQEHKWGQQNLPDGTHETFTYEANIRRASCQAAARADTVTWRHVLLEEVYEALAETDPAALRTELIQVAAVAAAWVEAIDRRTASL